MEDEQRHVSDDLPVSILSRPILVFLALGRGLKDRFVVRRVIMSCLKLTPSWLYKLQCYFYWVREDATIKHGSCRTVVENQIAAKFELSV